MSQGGSSRFEVSAPWDSEKGAVHRARATGPNGIHLRAWKGCVSWVWSQVLILGSPEGSPFCRIRLCCYTAQLSRKSFRSANLRRHGVGRR